MKAFPQKNGTIFPRKLSQSIIILNLEWCFWRSKKIKGKSFWQDMFELFLDILYIDGFTTIVMGRSKLSNMILYAITKESIYEFISDSTLRSYLTNYYSTEFWLIKNKNYTKDIKFAITPDLQYCTAC